MSRTIQKQIHIPRPPGQVWPAIADSGALAVWMFPNDFQPVLGHRFTFRVPGDPQRHFEGLTVRCEVLECEAPAAGRPGRLAFSWSAGGPVENTHVSFVLEADGDGTRLKFEHSGFDLDQPFGEQAVKGADYGWSRMLGGLGGSLAAAGPATITSRLISASPGRIFAAFENPEQLSRWWGPAGFSNTFEIFEFAPGGAWQYIMHGPNGRNFPNRSVFREIVPHSRIVIEHVSQPRYTLTIALSPTGENTNLIWRQEFETAEITAKLRSVVDPANEQNLDRLEAIFAQRDE